MISIRSSVRRILAPAAVKAGAIAAGGAVAAAVGLTTAFGAPASAATAGADSVSFPLQASSPAIAACLPHASGQVTITPGKLNDTMHITVTGMPANAGFDLFVIQQPTAPFGVAWYQTDVQANALGTGSATVKGVFDVETFSVSLAVPGPPLRRHEEGPAPHCVGRPFLVVSWRSRAAAGRGSGGGAWTGTASPAGGSAPW